MHMAQLEQTELAAPQDALPMEAEHRRLQKLVGELLLTNQELRFKLDELERQAESAKQPSAFACAAAVML
jgi:hypothetical protein